MRRAAQIVLVLAVTGSVARADVTARLEGMYGLRLNTGSYGDQYEYANAYGVDGTLSWHVGGDRSRVWIGLGWWLWFQRNRSLASTNVDATSFMLHAGAGPHVVVNLPLAWPMNFVAMSGPELMRDSVPLADGKDQFLGVTTAIGIERMWGASVLQLTLSYSTALSGPDSFGIHLAVGWWGH